MAEKKVIIPQGMQSSYDRLHFAPAVVDGDRLFCSGVIGTAADMRVPPDPEAQFTQAFENLKSLLEAAGASLADLIEMTTFHLGFNTHIATFMSVKDKFIHPPYPAWTAIGVSELAFGALVEIRVVSKVAAAGGAG